MKFLSVLVMLAIFIASYSEESTESSRATFPLATIPTEATQADSHGEAAAKRVLSSRHLIKIYDLSKNISHFKGIYREGGDGKEVRRSIVRKATISTNSDIMKEILLTFDSAEDKLRLLEQMEDLVHEYQVAVRFATLGGMKIISPLLFSYDDDIVLAVALVLGSAMQSNPEVQKIARKQNIGRQLFFLLAHQSTYVVPRIVFATSTFLRNYPEAQEEFICANGVARLEMILESTVITTNTKVKIITLFGDLVVEQKTAKPDQKGRSQEQIKGLQRVFTSEIDRNHICAHVAVLLDLEDFEEIHRLIDAMMSLYSICSIAFKLDLVTDRILDLLKIYGHCKLNPLYLDIDEYLRESLFRSLIQLYVQITDGADTTYLSMSKYFTKDEL